MLLIHTYLAAVVNDILKLRTQTEKCYANVLVETKDGKHLVMEQFIFNNNLLFKHTY